MIIGPSDGKFAELCGPSNGTDDVAAECEVCVVSPPLWFVALSLTGTSMYIWFEYFSIRCPSVPRIYWWSIRRVSLPLMSTALG